MKLDFRAMDEASAQAITRWRYEPPYDVYNVRPDAVHVFLDPKNAYYRITDGQGQLIAFCCFGPDAQVPGGDYTAAALDIGLGVRPDLTGKGQGLRYVAAVLAFAGRTFAATRWRVTVAKFNRRALRVWEKAGFRPVQTFRRGGAGRAFVVLARDARGEMQEGAETHDR